MAPFFCSTNALSFFFQARPARRYEVASNRDDDRDGSSRFSKRANCWLTVRDDDVRVEMDEFDSQKLEPLRAALRPSRLDSYVLSVEITKVSHALPECADVDRSLCRRERGQDTDSRYAASARQHRSARRPQLPGQ